jgi:hypothetical protein
MRTQHISAASCPTPLSLLSTSAAPAQHPAASAAPHMQYTTCGPNPSSHSPLPAVAAVENSNRRAHKWMFQAHSQWILRQDHGAMAMVTGMGILPDCHLSTHHLRCGRKQPPGFTAMRQKLPRNERALITRCSPAHWFLLQCSCTLVWVQKRGEGLRPYPCSHLPQP